MMKKEVDKTPPFEGVASAVGIEQGRVEGENVNCVKGV